jgi:asparagine synthase (glutamine-hydrolysing)
MKEAGFENDFDYSKKIARHFNKKIKEISIDAIKNKSDFLSSIEKSTVLSEELIADLTFIPTLSISNKARELGYKVALSGMGADELFAGYSKYRLIRYRTLFCVIRPVVELFARLPYVSKKIERFKGFCKEKELVWQYTSILGYFNKVDIAENYKYFDIYYEKKYFQKLSDMLNAVKGAAIKKVLYLDIFGFLSHNFLVADKSSMRASLEIRVPLATKKLFEIAYNTDIKEMLTFTSTKIPLRKMLYRKLPRKLVDRQKTGFHPPMDSIMNKFDKVELMNIFEKNHLFDLINEEYVSRVITDHVDRIRNHTLKIFQLLYLSYWYKNNFRD